jgi:hypothetical protein
MFSYIQLVILPYLIFKFSNIYIYIYIYIFDGGHAWTIFCGASKGIRPCNGIGFCFNNWGSIPLQVTSICRVFVIFSTLVGYFVIVETL